jgi:hypothetical protein
MKRNVPESNGQALLVAADADTNLPSTLYFIVGEFLPLSRKKTFGK